MQVIERNTSRIIRRHLNEVKFCYEKELMKKPDLYGRVLETSELGLADEIAAAASLVMGQAAEGTPAVLVRSLSLPAGPGSAADLIRPRALDLFP